MRNPTVNRRWTAVVLASALSACFAAAQAQTPAEPGPEPGPALHAETRVRNPVSGRRRAAPRMSEQELRDTAIDAYVTPIPWC